MAVYCIAAEPLLHDGFESPAREDDRPRGWTLNDEARRQRVVVDHSQRRTGKASLAIRSLVTTKRPAIVSRRVAVKPDTTCALTLWTRRDSYVYGTSFEVVLLKDDRKVGVQRKSFRGQRWRPITMVFDTGRADTAEIRIINPNTGDRRVTVGRTLWVDDITLVTVDDRDRVTLRPEVARDDQGQLTFDVDIPHTGPWHLWVRARCAGENQFALTEPSSRRWTFRSYTRSATPQWIRPVLPGLVLEQGKQDLGLTIEGDEVQLEQVVLTMNPFWRPDDAPELMRAKHLLDLRRRGGFKPVKSNSVDLVVLCKGEAPKDDAGPLPFRQGVPLPHGHLRDPRHVRLLDSSGKPVPAQASALTRYPDGSIAWLVVSGTVPAPATYRLEYGTEIEPRRFEQALSTRQDITGVTIDTGTMTLRLNAQGPDLFGNIVVDGRKAVEGGLLKANGRFVDDDTSRTISLEEAGPAAATVRVAGRYVHEGKHLLHYVMRLHVWAGSSMVEIEHTFIRRDGPDQLPLDDVAMEFRFDEAAQPTAVQAPGQGEAELTDDGSVTLLQQLGGREKGPSDYPWSLKTGDQAVAQGTHCDGAIVTRSDGMPVAAATRHFWQNAPKRYTITRDRLTVGLVPVGQPVTFWRGQAKTHTVLVGFGSGAATALRKHRLDPQLVAPAAWYARTRAFNARPAPRRREQYSSYERCIDDTLDRWTDEFDKTLVRPAGGGLVNAGDIGSGTRVVNLETALGEGLMVQFVRTGQRRLFDYADLALRHFSDIDIDHGNGSAGLIWVHAAHGRPIKNLRTDGIHGHSWFNGTAYHGLFTGARRVIEQAQEVGDYYKQHRFSPRAYIHYWRQPAWKLMCLMQAFDLTGRLDFLDAARREVELTRAQQDHVVTLWPYMSGVGFKAVRHYVTSTGDPVARELYLQLLDGFMHQRSRDGDTVNGEHLKPDGMLLGNFPLQRSCVIYNELAHASFLSGDPRIARAAAEDLNIQTRFGVNDPTLLFGSADLVMAMHELKIDEPTIAAVHPMAFMPSSNAGQPLAPEVTDSAITFQVVEKEDRDFEVHLFKGCYRKYTVAFTGKATLFGPDGTPIETVPVRCDGLRHVVLRGPADGQTGVYTVRVSLSDIWRWTVQDMTFELTPGKHTLEVASRYDRQWLDKLVLTPHPGEFPWEVDALSEQAIVMEAEDYPATGFDVFKHPGASGGKYVRRVDPGADTRQRFTFTVPGNRPVRYRLHARTFKPRADLLNLWMDGGKARLLYQVHDMDPNTYPIWSVNCTLGPDAVLRYWETPRPGRPGVYTTEHLRPIKTD